MSGVEEGERQVGKRKRKKKNWFWVIETFWIARRSPITSPSPCPPVSSFQNQNSLKTPRRRCGTISRPGRGGKRQALDDDGSFTAAALPFNWGNI